MKEKAKAKEILQKIIPFLGIILMIIIFQVGGEGKLLTKGNINSILNQTVYIAIMAFGAIFVYSHGGMDLSYLHNDGVYAWTTDEVDQLIKSKNKNASSDELLEMGKNYSIEDTIARHGK